MSGINLPAAERDPSRLNLAIRQMMQGRSNAAGSCTLAAGAATTVVTAPNCAAGSQVFLFPSTAHAAAEFGNGTIWVSAVANGSFTVTHANNTQTDRNFSFVCLG